MPTQDTLTDEQIFDIVQPHLPGRGHAHIWTTDPSYARDVGIEVGSRWIVSEMLPEQTVAAARAIEAAARAPLLERIAELEARASGLTNTWRPMETAPKDGTPIVGLCDHGASAVYVDDTHLTDYAARCEGLSHVQDGPHVISWEPAYEVSDGWESQSYTVPGGWTLTNDFEVMANPVKWMPIPSPLNKGESHAIT